MKIKLVEIVTEPNTLRMQSLVNENIFFSAIQDLELVYNDLVEDGFDEEDVVVFLSNKVKQALLEMSGRR